MDATDILGLTAGAITSLGFIPQLIRGFRTKKLDDVSYYMPLTLAFGMMLWLIYGIVVEKLPIIVANGFGISCCFVLIFMKKIYSLSYSMVPSTNEEEPYQGEQ
jgi:MtN3 and saliva related transmembrane protein